ncbi:hypothetical protein ABEB36_009165 [Hypothenemus hampei]|uniref:Uncharacterized protein n=1 Tax=Hypothenemus hampei TaxID=57062 RepID=A0ABD1ETB8_HYPHA
MNEKANASRSRVMNPPRRPSSIGGEEKEGLKTGTCALLKAEDRTRLAAQATVLFCSSLQAGSVPWAGGRAAYSRVSSSSCRPFSGASPHFCAPPGAGCALRLRRPSADAPSLPEDDVVEYF